MRLPRARLAHVLATVAVTLPAVIPPDLPPWPVAQIRVHNPTGYQRSTRMALDAWNATGVTPRLVLVREAERADVTMIASDAALAARCDERYRCGAYGELRGDRGRIWLPALTGSEMVSSRLVRMIVHELGHVLGLGHDREGCAVMSIHLGVAGCAAPALGGVVCGPLPRDVAAAERLYGRDADPGYDASCPWTTLVSAG